MRFKALLFLLSISCFSLIKSMNFGLPQQEDFGDDDDLTYLQKTKKYLKRHPIRSLIYFSVLAGTVSGGIFAYKTNPKEFWNAVAGLKEAWQDLVDDVRGRGRRSEPFEQNYQPNLVTNKPSIWESLTRQNNNQTVSSQNQDTKEFTIEDVRKDKEIIKKLKDDLIKDPETIKKLTPEFIDQITHEKHIPEKAKHINDACLVIYKAKTWPEVEKHKFALETAVKNGKTLNQVTNNPIFEKVIKDGETTLTHINDLIRNNNKKKNVLLQEKMKNSDIVNWVNTTDFLDTTKEELKAVHACTSEDLLYTVGSEKIKITAEIYNRWRHINKGSDWAKIISGFFVGAAALYTLLWYTYKLA